MRGNLSHVVLRMSINRMSLLGPMCGPLLSRTPNLNGDSREPLTRVPLGDPVTATRKSGPFAVSDCRSWPTFETVVAL